MPIIVTIEILIIFFSSSLSLSLFDSSKTCKHFRSEKNSMSSNNNSCNQGNETQQMSIGSVGSITASPMQQNLSVHSQPSSIPINDQNIISPHQNDVSPHPLTPILENNNVSNNNNNNLGVNSNNHNNNNDQKTDIDNLKTTNGQMNNKHDKNSLLQQQQQQKSGSTQDHVNDATIQKMLSNGQPSSITAKHGDSSSLSSTKENALKRPALLIRDCEKNDEEDFNTNQSLYDYSTWDAW